MLRAADSSHTISLVKIFDKNGLQIKFHLTPETSGWKAEATFINVTPVPFTGLEFQLAVPKVSKELPFGHMDVYH